MKYYFDNAATSFPKPKSVLKAMESYFLTCGANPGRSGHRMAVEAGKIVLDAREALADLFNVADSSHILFTRNATESINIVLKGLLKKGDHVITSSMEHNSVLRPLNALKAIGVDVTVVSADREGAVYVSEILDAVTRKTKLLCLTHASNVTGGIMDIKEAGRLCGEKKIRFLVDAAQSAGVLRIDVEEMNIDYLAFSGHKGLLGPQGTGGLFVRNESDLAPLMYGGTGSLSDREEQPDFLPDKYESGTLNVIGIAGLAAGLTYLKEEGIDNILHRDRRYVDLILDGIKDLPEITVYGRKSSQTQTGVLSVNFAGLSPSDAGEILDGQFGIAVRVGLHCAPAAHKTIGTFPDGTVRFSWGPFVKEKDIKYMLKAMKELVEIGREKAKSSATATEEGA